MPQPVPRLWPGETVAIAASGPSLTADQLAAVRGKARLIVINTTFRSAPWADLLYAADHGWWAAYPDSLDFAGLKVTQDHGSAPVPAGVSVVESLQAEGLSLDGRRIHRGGNSGYQALNLAVLLGARRVLLLGYDFRHDGRRRHHHGDHPAPLKNPSASTLADWAKRFETATSDLAKAGVEVVNCSPGSAVTCFPFQPIHEALQ